MKRFFFLLCLFALSAALYSPAQDVPQPTVDGYITAITSKTAFDVNGQPVTTTPQTTYAKRVITKDEQSDDVDPSLAGSLALGEQIQVFGDKHGKQIVAMQIFIEQHPDETVSGSAVIQGITGVAPNMTLEADGYQIAITPKTNVSYGSHLSKGTALSPGMWVEYSGKWNSQGSILADRAKFSEFSLTSHFKRMQKLGAKTTLPEGSDPKTLERVQKIGTRLVPSFQKNLPADDPQKINFQFGISDKDILYIPASFQNGYIVLCKHAVDLLQNDDQVAAVLANGMAQLLEWQMPHYDGVQLSGKGQTQALAMAFFAPPIINMLAPIPYDMTINWNAPLSVTGKQKERVALSLMRDAGYDIHQAPIAWQQIGSQYPKKSNTPLMPQRSIYAIHIIAEEYPDTSNKQVATKVSPPVK